MMATSLEVASNAGPRCRAGCNAPTQAAPGAADLFGRCR